MCSLNDAAETKFQDRARRRSERTEGPQSPKARAFKSFYRLSDEGECGGDGGSGHNLRSSLRVFRKPTNHPLLSDIAFTKGQNGLQSKNTPLLPHMQEEMTSTMSHDS